MGNTTVFEGFVLPSKGMIYDEPIEPHVQLRSMTTMDEMKRLSPTDTPYKVMADIIEDCMIEKPKIHVYDLCLGDYQFLLHKLRTVTYGNQYKMIVSCPSCGQTVESIADLDSLDVIEFDESSYDLMRISLPSSNKLIDLKYQTPRDLDTIAFRKKEMQKKTKLNVDYGLLYSTISMIKKVDGSTLNSIALEEFVKQLPMKDVNAIIQASDKLNRKVGVDNSVIVKCGSCGYEIVTSFRITSEFFGPTI